MVESVTKVAAVKATADKDVVDLLESMLVDARAGQIRAIILVSENDTGETSHSFVFRIQELRPLVMELELAKHKFVKQLMGDD
jgi:hypothetical protein